MFCHSRTILSGIHIINFPDLADRCSVIPERFYRESMSLTFFKEFFRHDHARTNPRYRRKNKKHRGEI